MATIEAPRAVRRRSALARLTITEAKLFLRDRVGPIWGIGFPMLLLIIFGSIPSFSKPQAAYGGLTVLDVYVPILILMMLALLSLVAMPLVLAGYREKGTLRRLRTTPAGPARVLAAQLIVNAATVVLTVVLILVVAGLAYSVPLPRQFGAWLLAALLAAAALMAVGLCVAAVAPTGRTASVIGAILFYPLMFFSGLWLPIPSMPVTLQHLSHATPLGAAWEAFDSAALGHWPSALPLVTLVIYAVVFGLAVTRLFRWE